MKKKDYIISSEYEQVTPLCKEIRTFCLDKISNKSFCSEIEICLVESLNNIIKHAYKEKPGNQIKVSVTNSSEAFEVILMDKGEARTNFEKPKLEFDPDDIENVPEGGMGLYIIDQIMDETEYKSEEGVNYFRMKKIVS